MAGKIKKLLHNLRHNFRGAAEYKALCAEWPAIQQATPQGDGHPVLLIPGFSANDKRMDPLCRALCAKGYRAETWGMGRNLGLSKKTVRLLREKLEGIYAANGNRKVTIIGHSLGGFYARELAREFPHMVKAVISVGTPFGVGLSSDKKIVLPPLRKAIEILNGSRVRLSDPDMARRLMTPPFVPVTSIFSRDDLVADWRVCLNPAAPQAENVEVKNASHLGLVYHPDVFRVILNRLAQAEGAWRPYHPQAQVALPPNPQWAPSPQKNNVIFGKKPK